MLVVSYVDREVCFLLLRIGGNHIPGYASVKRVTAIAIILFSSVSESSRESIMTDIHTRRRE
jgi:hypothetical protein